MRSNVSSVAFSLGGPRLSWPPPPKITSFIFDVAFSARSYFSSFLQIYTGSTFFPFSLLPLALLPRFRIAIFSLSSIPPVISPIPLSPPLQVCQCERRPKIPPYTQPPAHNSSVFASALRSASFVFSHAPLTSDADRFFTALFFCLFPFALRSSDSSAWPSTSRCF